MRYTSFVFAFTSLSILAGANWACADDTLSREAREFSGRVLAVGCKDAPGGWVALKDGKVRSFGGRPYLVGKPLSGDLAEQADQLPMWIAMDQVPYIREFEDVDAMKKALSVGVTAKFSAADPASEVTEWEGLSVKFPIEYTQGRKDQISKLRLFVSTDRGRTWKIGSEAGPEEQYLKFTASSAGEYWFVLQIEDKSGRSEPSEAAMVANVKMRFKDPKPRSETQDGPRRIPPGRQ